MNDRVAIAAREPSPMNLTLRQQNAHDRREIILDEAARIIGRCGYHGFGLQELAQKCGLTKAGLLYHFESKDQLLIALLRDRDQKDEMAIAPRISRSVQSSDVSYESLAHVVASLRAIVERNSAQPELVRLYGMLRAEALNPDHPANAYFTSRDAATLDIFTQAVAMHVAEPRSVARQLVGLMTGLELQWLRERKTFDLVAEWDRGVAKVLPSPA